MSVKQFEIDLARGQKAEHLVMQVLSQLTNEYTFTHIGNLPDFYHRGDILAQGNGEFIYLDIKDDTVIHETYNVLVEEEVYFKDSDYYKKGFAYSDYDILCVLSRAARKMYFIDFKKLKEFYKQGEYKRINHADQFSECYLVPLGLIRRKGAMVKELNY